MLFVEGAALGFSAAAQPGPLQAYLLAQSVRNGSARTLPVALVPLATDPPLIAVVLAVLAQVPRGSSAASGSWEARSSSGSGSPRCAPRAGFPGRPPVTGHAPGSSAACS